MVSTASRDNKHAKSSRKVYKKKPVILQVLPELKSGGVERGTVEITKAAVEQGFEVVVASAGGQLTSQVNSAGGKHIALPLASKNPFVMFRNIFRLGDVIRENGVDIVHARSRAPAWSAFYASRNESCHFMTTFHGVYTHKNSLKRFYNSIMLRGKRVITASKYIYNHIIDHYDVDENKLRLIPRGVDLNQFDIEQVSEGRIMQLAEQLNIEHDCPIILLPGRLTRWKGHMFLLDALALMKDEKFLCLFVGDDNHHESYGKFLKKQIKQMGLAGSVRVLGNIMDMPAMYSLADIVVSASIRPESFGRVAVEAQAMGRLVVATAHGGSCETVLDNKTGWLVLPNDTNELVNVLTKALHLKEKTRKVIANRAKRQIHDNFSLGNMVSKTLDVYRELV